MPCGLHEKTRCILHVLGRLIILSERDPAESEGHVRVNSPFSDQNDSTVSPSLRAAVNQHLSSYLALLSRAEVAGQSWNGWMVVQNWAG
jgi:hypothetical protein